MQFEHARDDLYFAAEVRRLSGVCLARQGHADEARARLCEAREIARAQGATMFELVTASSVLIEPFVFAASMAAASVRGAASAMRPLVVSSRTDLPGVTSSSSASMPPLVVTASTEPPQRASLMWPLVVPMRCAPCTSLTSIAPLVSSRSRFMLRGTVTS